MKTVLLFLCRLFFLLAFCLTVKAGTVDTVSIFSASMNKNISCVVIRPDEYASPKKRFPVVYLLHGYDGWYSNWILREPKLKSYVDSFHLMIVCPDGAKASWYFDSPVDPAYRYETHLVKEVVGYIDKHYKTLADKRHRAITGLSMGGHGALFLALRHPDVFGAAGSMSGALDLNDIRRQFEVSSRIGDTVNHAANWHDLSIYYLVETKRATPVKLIIDCGYNDIFISANRRVHQKLLQLKIKHEYTERPGVHGWDYWRGSLPVHLLFFRRFFQKSG